VPASHEGRSVRHPGSLTRYRPVVQVRATPVRLSGRSSPVNQGVNAAAGSSDARGALLDTFARLDARLGGQRYLLGDRITEADVRLWVTLVRYDAQANADRRINDGLPEYPNLWA
jgi:glutathione S-transferase